MVFVVVRWAEAVMARRRIGQEPLLFGSSGAPGGTSLDEVAALIDWATLDHLLAGISAAAKGEARWPPLALFKALLVATWHDLSDATCPTQLIFPRVCGHGVSSPSARLVRA